MVRLHTCTKKKRYQNRKHVFSSKTEQTAACDLTWSTATGLVFEYFPLFGGRGGGRQIVEFMGSLGPTNAPIRDWKDVAINDPWRPAVDTPFLWLF